jgi:hypothetical protein
MMQLSHDRELRALQSKPMMPPSNNTRRKNLKANRNTRRSGSIAQPRKTNF